MRLIFWESNCQQVIAEIRDKGEDIDCSVVSAQGELESSLDSGEIAVVVIDVEGRVQEMGPLLEDFHQKFPHCFFCASYQNLKNSERGPLEGAVVKFLKRPHKSDDLLGLAQECRNQLFQDIPVDMSQDGTEEIDVVGTLHLQPSSSDGQDSQGEDEKDLSLTSINATLPREESEETKKTSLEILDDDKEDIALKEESGELELNTNVLEVPPLGDSSKPVEDESLLFEHDNNDHLASVEESVVEESVLEEEESSDGDEGDSLGDITLGGVPDHPSLKESGVEEPDLPEPPMMDINQLKEEGESISQHHSDELLQLKSNLESLREDRELLLQKTEKMEREESELRHKFNRLQAELDEAKIEIIFFKKRYNKDIDHFKYVAKLAQEKRDILVDKNKKLKCDLELAEKRVSLDMAKVKEREQILEGQLELLKSDSEGLLKSRDNMIRELKRQADLLKFDFETAQKRGREFQEERCELEDRLDYVKKNLQRIISSLDEELLAEKSEDLDKKIVGF